MYKNISLGLGECDSLLSKFICPSALIPILEARYDAPSSNIFSSSKVHDLGSQTPIYTGTPLRPSVAKSILGS